MNQYLTYIDKHFTYDEIVFTITRIRNFIPINALFFFKFRVLDHMS